MYIVEATFVHKIWIRNLKLVFIFTNWCTSELSKKNFKIHIKTAPTYFGAVTPSLHCSEVVCSRKVQRIHQQGPTDICSHITTHRCILIGYFNNCNLSKHEWCAPWWWCDYTETCRSCFNVNSNIVFKTIHLCISWWIKSLLYKLWFLWVTTVW
jgi:hypothetical protein